MDQIEILVKVSPVKSDPYTHFISTFNGFWNWNEATHALGIVVNWNTFKDSLGFQAFDFSLNFWIEVDRNA